MKNIILYLLVLGLFIASCEEEDKYTPPPPEKELIEVGDVEAYFEAKTFSGETTTQVPMGETVTFLDLSKGNPNLRNWNLEGATPQSSDDLSVSVIYEIPGNYDVTLSVTREADGQTDEVTIADYIEVLSIPVEADFVPSVSEENGVVNIKTGDKITFTDASSGLPEIWAWEFEGGTPATSTEQSPEIQYVDAGLYAVKLKATRDDAGNLVEDELVKMAYINVVQRVVDYAMVAVTDDVIKITYTEPLAQDIPANATSEFSITIQTAGGATLNPSLTGVSRIDDYNIELTFSDKMYTDDDVFISYNPTGVIKDATGLYNPEPLMDEPCMNGKNLWDNGIYGFESGQDNWSEVRGADGIFEISDEKPYSGKYSMKLTSEAGGDWIGGSSAAVPTDLVPGTTYTFYWYVWRDPSSTHAALGPWLAWTGGQQQFWTSLNDNPNGEWYKITKQYTYNGPGDAWFWVRVKDRNIVYIDNITILEPDPRP